MAPRALLLRAADALTDHPGPTVTRLQRVVMGCLLTVMFAGIHYGKKWWPCDSE